MCYTTTPLVFKNKEKQIEKKWLHCKASRVVKLRSVSHGYLWGGQHGGGLYFRPWEHKEGYIFLKALQTLRALELL